MTADRGVRILLDDEVVMSGLQGWVLRDRYASGVVSSNRFSGSEWSGASVGLLAAIPVKLVAR